MSQNRQKLEEGYLAILKDVAVLARTDIRKFSQIMKLDHDLQWFHNKVYSFLEKWVAKEIKNLAIFIPPQHGKSTMSSINTPAYIFGKNPKATVVCCSYTQGVSSKFNRECQDLMESAEYRMIFPKTRIPSTEIETKNELRNSTYFETVGAKGFYKSVGVGGSLTGTPIEYGIIDDPIKDRKEANSSTYRENLWNWYNDVFKTRLSNDSCQLMLFTRWHNDDLAGRLFDPKNEHYDETEAKKWTVIVLPALKEDQTAIDSQIDIKDPREEGEALWEEKHSKETHEADKRTNPTKFGSLKQQRPSPLEGGIIPRAGFVYMNEKEVPFNPEEVPVQFMIDGAFTEKTTNDPSAQMAYRVHKGKIYIYNCTTVRLGLDKYLPFLKGYLRQNGYNVGSLVKIEAKASGLALIPMMRTEEHGSFNVGRINDTHVSWGKITRAEYSSPSVASEKVVLIKGSWNSPFVEQCCNFPNDTHDDMLDLLCYSVLENLRETKHNIIKTNVNLKRNPLF